jgi:hypothetical protein
VRVPHSFGRSLLHQGVRSTRGGGVLSFFPQHPEPTRMNKPLWVWLVSSRIQGAAVQECSGPEWGSWADCASALVCSCQEEHLFEVMWCVLGVLAKAATCKGVGESILKSLYNGRAFCLSVWSMWLSAPCAVWREGKSNLFVRCQGANMPFLPHLCSCSRDQSTWLQPCLCSSSEAV